MYYSPSRAPQQSLQYRTTTQKGQDSNTGFRNEVKAMWNPYSFYLPFGATRGTSEVLYTQGTRYNYTGVKEEPSFGRIQHPIDETSGPRQQNHYHIATDTACYGVSHARLQQYNAIYRGREDIYKYYETPSPPTYVYEPIEHLQSEVVHHDTQSRELVQVLIEVKPKYGPDYEKWVNGTVLRSAILSDFKGGMKLEYYVRYLYPEEREGSSRWTWSTFSEGDKNIRTPMNSLSPSKETDARDHDEPYKEEL